MFLREPPVDDAVRAMYDEDLDENGYVSNLTRLWAWRPDVWAAFSQTRATNGAAMALTPAEVAVVIAAAVAQRSDSYCSLAWGARLAEESAPDVAGAVLAGGPLADLAGHSDRGAALATWARQVARDPTTTTVEDVERLRAVGLDDRAIFEVTALVAFRMAFSAVNSALAALPDHQLALEAPDAVRDAVTYGRPVDPVPSEHRPSAPGR
jgi:alkylhydroperoxidase family enzyme